MNYEEINNQIRALTTEATLHAPVERTAREGFFKNIIGDIAAAVGEIYSPESKLQASKGEGALATGKVAGGSAHAVMDRSCHVRAISSQLNVLAKANLSNRRKFVADAEWDDDTFNREGFLAHVISEAEEILPVCTIKFDVDVGSNAVKKILKFVLRGCCSYYGKRQRYHSNRKGEGALATDRKEHIHE